MSVVRLMFGLTIFLLKKSPSKLLLKTIETEREAFIALIQMVMLFRLFIIRFQINVDILIIFGLAFASPTQNRSIISYLVSYLLISKWRIHMKPVNTGTPPGTTAGGGYNPNQPGQPRQPGQQPGQ